MNTIKLFTLSLALAFVSFAQQNTFTQTTLSGAVGQNTTLITVASATGITAANPNTVLYIDKEAMRVTAVNGTSISVTRGISGTAAVGHPNSSTVLIGRPDWYNTYDPGGACTAASVYASPWINILTGQQWLCSTVTLSWVPGFGNRGTSSVPVLPTAAVASAAGKITPSGPLFHVTGTAAITGFNIPVGFLGGPVCIIPDGIFTTTTANNIALASTAVVGKQLCYFYDSATAKFYPSY